MTNFHSEIQVKIHMNAVNLNKLEKDAAVDASHSGMVSLSMLLSQFLPFAPTIVVLLLLAMHLVRRQRRQRRLHNNGQKQYNITMGQG